MTEAPGILPEPQTNKTGLAVGFHQDVLGTDVAVQKTVLVESVQRIQNLKSQVENLNLCAGPRGHPVSQRFCVQVLKDQHDLAFVVLDAQIPHEIRMLQTSGRCHFTKDNPPESIVSQRAARENLENRLPLGRFPGGDIQGSRRAGGQRPQDPIPANLFSNRHAHGTSDQSDEDCPPT